MRVLTRFPAAFALGAATAFFLDPRDGTRRRHELRDRALRGLRRLRQLVVKKSKLFRGRVQGIAHQARSSVEGPVGAGQVATDDATVRQRILSDALRRAGVGTSEVEVDVHDGVATLRGTVASPSLADDLVAAVREVPGVREVEPAITVGARGGALDQGV
jgi:osmotically-inducible protein OsmY